PPHVLRRSANPRRPASAKDHRERENTPSASGPALSCIWITPNKSTPSLAGRRGRPNSISAPRENELPPASVRPSGNWQGRPRPQHRRFVAHAQAPDRRRRRPQGRGAPPKEHGPHHNRHLDFRVLSRPLPRTTPQPSHSGSRIV